MNGYEWPHVRVSAQVLAKWLRESGGTTMWSVDGDPYLTERASFPMFGEELAEVFAREDRYLQLRIVDDQSRESGESIDSAELSAYMETDHPTGDRLAAFRWEDAPEWEWLLVEDSETTAIALETLQDGE